MPTDGRTPASLLYYLVAPSAAGVLVPALRRHFTLEPRVAVLVERRAPADGPPAPGPERRRAPVAERDPARALPSALRPEADHLRLVQPMVPVGRAHEGTDLGTLIARSIA